MPDLPGLVLVVVAFVVGAIPWGYLVGKLAGGIDLRQVGSGGTGATNVLRTLGARASALVLVLDAVKGALPVLIGRSLGIADIWIAAAAVAAVAGHCWSPFIGFKGGKGVATGAGAAIALVPQLVVLVVVMVLVVWRTRYVSLGSLLVVTFAAVAMVASAALGLAAWPTAMAIIAIGGIIIYRHQENITRLRAGTERRFGEKVPAPPQLP